MKNFKLSYLLLMVTTVLFASCSKDDTNSNVNPATIVGKWKGIDITTKGTTTISGAGINNTMDFTTTSVSVDVKAEFMSSPNQMTASGTYTSKMKSVYLGQNIEQTVTAPYFSNTASWNIAGNQLTLTKNGTTETYTILELTSTRLKYTGKITTVTQNGGITTTQVVEGTNTFEKVQ